MHPKLHMISLRVLIILVAANFFSGVDIYAQENQFYYKHYNAESGLIFDEILYAHIDDDGFIWLATAMGLQCIEGYSIKEFYHNPGNPSSLSDNFITTLYEGDSGKIWIGTARNGLNYYDRKYEKFGAFNSIEGNPNTLSDNQIPRAKKSIDQDRNGFIWINTENGLNKLDPGNKSFKRYIGEDNDLLKYYGQIIYDKTEHAIWIADDDLRRFDIDTEELQTFEFTTKSKMQVKQVNAIMQDADGFLWLGTDVGIFIFNKDKGRFIALHDLPDLGNKPVNVGDWLQKPIKGLYEDINSNIWIAVEKSVFILDTKSGQVTELKHELENKNSLIDEQISGLYGNKSGVVLVTYIRGGVTKINIETNRFRHLTFDKNPSNNVNSKAVRSILKDQKGNLWVGTYFGLNFLPASGNEPVKYYFSDPQNPNTITSNYIAAIYIDKNQRLWIGTFENGFCYADNVFDSKDLKFVRSNFQEDVEVHEFMEDQYGRVWISTDQGFYIYDYDSDALTQYGDMEGEVEEVKELNIQSVHMEAQNILWLATWNSGFAKLIINEQDRTRDPNSPDKLTYYNSTDNKELDAISDGFITILKGDDNSFWLGSNVDGLVKVNITGEEAEFEKYNRLKGAPSNTIYGIQKDKSGNVWVSSARGIGKFDPITERFSNFYESDGLQGNQFSWDAQFKTEEGEIYFGGINGITAFYPEDINQIKLNAKAYLSRLIVNHEEVRQGQEVNGNVILEKSIRYTNSITLTHLESILSIEFGVLKNDNPSNVMYAYMLEGYDDRWINANSENRIATYTNLPSGTYQFMVRASNKPGSWDEAAAINIIILPPWWKTWWAYLFYLGVFLLLVYLLQQQLLNRAELAHKLEMEQMMHERDMELSRQKFNFFTNLSHEFRTPLTLILGPLEKMIQKNEASNRVHQKHLLIQRQAQKMLKLTNRLLNFQKYEIENLRLSAAEGNIIKFLDEVMIAFRNQARLRDIHFSFKASSKDIDLWYDRDKVEIILSNLFSNAFKFTPSKGTIDFKVKVVSKEEVEGFSEANSDSGSVFYGDLQDGADNYLQMVIKDSGCGIASDQLQNIFKHYYQSSNLTFSNAEGSGIGLEITKNYVELHKGCIMAKSTEGAGTTFYVWLPTGNKHLSSEEMIEDFKSSEHLDHYQIGKIAEQTTSDGNEELLEPAVLEDLSEILIIDDNPDILVYLKTIFEKHFKVHLGRDGKEGLEMALELIPDLIISDVMMPEINGFDLCAMIKADVNTSHIPVILLTARTSTIFQDQGIETGADDYITKPFSEKTLLLKVKNLISSRLHLRAKYAREITLKPRDITINSTDEKFLDQVIEIIEEDMSNGNFKIEDYSKRLWMSHSGI